MIYKKNHELTYVIYLKYWCYRPNINTPHCCSLRSVVLGPDATLFAVFVKSFDNWIFSYSKSNTDGSHDFTWVTALTNYSDLHTFYYHDQDVKHELWWPMTRASTAPRKRNVTEWRHQNDVIKNRRPTWKWQQGHASKGWEESGEIEGYKLETER